MRLIDADAAAEYFEKVRKLTVARTIQRFPTIDTVKHGKWDTSQSEIVGGLYHKVSECSECGWIHDMFITFNYCPNCGASMEDE